MRGVRLPSAGGGETNTRHRWGVGVGFHEVTRSINFESETQEDQGAKKGEKQKNDKEVCQLIASWSRSGGLRAEHGMQRRVGRRPTANTPERSMCA